MSKLLKDLKQELYDLRYKLAGATETIDALSTKLAEKERTINTLIKDSKASKKILKQRITDLETELAESKENFIVANNLRKNSDEVLLNYKTEKYGLDKTIQELRKIKLSFPEKEWYYKGFENCERQMSRHIADLTLEVKQLKQQLAESKIEQLKKENPK